MEDARIRAFIGVMLCCAAALPGVGRTGSQARAATVPAVEVEPVRGPDGQLLGTVEWSKQRVVSQGFAYADPGAGNESSGYWRAASRARRQAVENLQSLVFLVGQMHHLPLRTEAVQDSAARALVIDRDFNQSSGQVTLTVAASLYGRFGALSQGEDPVFDPYSRPAVRDPEPVHIENTSTRTPPAPAAPEIIVASGTPAGQQGPFTGVVIDCRGLHLSPSMSPKLRRLDGREVWGTVQVTHQYAEEVGIAGFMDVWDRALAYEPRIGKHPLILRAVDCTGGRFRSEAVITDVDADWMLQEDARTHFLSQFHVMFVIDPLKVWGG